METNGVKNLDGLREKLEGVFDLDTLEDCHKIIGAILRSNNDKTKNLEDAKSRLNVLAWLVINGNPKALADAEDIVNISRDKRKSNVLEVLNVMASSMANTEGLNDEKLVEAMFDKVYPNFDISSEESAILDELILRFKKYAGLPIQEENA